MDRETNYFRLLLWNGSNSDLANMPQAFDCQTSKRFYSCEKPQSEIPMMYRRNVDHLHNRLPCVSDQKEHASTLVARGGKKVGSNQTGHLKSLDPRTEVQPFPTPVFKTGQLSRLVVRPKDGQLTDV